MPIAPYARIHPLFMRQHALDRDQLLIKDDVGQLGAYFAHCVYAGVGSFPQWAVVWVKSQHSSLFHCVDWTKGEVAITLIDAVGPIVPGLYVLLRFTTTDKVLFLLIVLDTGFVTFSVLMLSLLILAKRRAVGVGELVIVRLLELEVR